MDTGAGVPPAAPPDAHKRRNGSPDAFRGLTREQRHQLLCLTAASGSIENLELALDNAGLLLASAAWGVLDAGWAVEALCVTPGNSEDLLDWAASSGSVGLMAWLLDRGWASWGSAAVVNAAACGCEEALQWIVEQGCAFPVTGVPYVWAAIHGDLAMVRCLQRLGCPWGPNPLFECIRAEVALPMLQRLVELGCPLDRDGLARCRAAAGLGPDWSRKALLDWLDAERLRLSAGASRVAAVPCRIM